VEPHYGFVADGIWRLAADVAWDTYGPVNRLGEFVGERDARTPDHTMSSFMTDRPRNRLVQHDLAIPDQVGSGIPATCPWPLILRSAARG
jgi:hypothetical protein